MVLDNVIAFRFLKILDNLIFKQKSLFANNCCSKQNTKSNQTDLFFIFIELSETPKKFVKITLVLETRNFASFSKTLLYWKRGYIKMRKHTETFHARKDYKWKMFFLYQFRRFQNICSKTRPCTPLLLTQE